MPVAPPPTAPAPSTTPPAAPEEEKMEATFKLLYDAAETEAPAPEPNKPGKTLLQAIEEPVPETPEPTAEEKAAADKKKKDDEAAAAAAANTPPEPAPVRVKAKRQQAEPAPTPTPAPELPKPEPVATAPTEDEQFEAGLIEEERDRLTLARFAERKDPVKFKGEVARVTKFFKDHQAYLDKNPDATQPGGEAAEKYAAWMAKNNVNLPLREQKMLEREQIAEEATAKVTKETDAKLAEIYDDQFRRTEEPKIKARADELFSQMTKDAVPPELAKLAAEKGIEEARKEYPLEYRVSGEILTEIASDAEVLERLVASNPKTGKKLLDYDPYNAQHVRILEFVREQGDAFKHGTPGETKVGRDNRIKLQQRDGKSFLTRDEYFALPEKQRTPYWTFSVEQINRIAGIRAKDRIAAKVKAERERLESEGWVRKPAGAKPVEAPPAPGSPPAPRPTPMPNGGPSGAEVPDRSMSLLMGE